MFTQYFLTDGIRATPEWEAAAAQLADFRHRLGRRYGRFAALHQPNEAVTEQDLIRPVLALLGWSDYLPQQGAAGREDVPDHLLFARRRAAPGNAALCPRRRRHHTDVAAVADDQGRASGFRLDARRSR